LPSGGCGGGIRRGSAAAVEGVLVECAGLLVFAQYVHGVGEVVGRAEGVGVVVAEDASAAGQGVLVELAGLVVFSQHVEVGSEAVG
jgi:hypothetical protein